MPGKELPLAILAGGGRLPLLIAESVTARGGSVHIVAIRGEADSGIERYPQTWVNWGQIGRAIKAIKTHGGGTMVIAGRVSRPDLMTLRPDLELLRNVPAIARIVSAGGDNDVLTRVITFFEGCGLVVKGVHEVAPELVATAADTNPAPCPEASRDIALGTRVLAALADLDVGQAIAVADGRVVAIEGVDGTDRMLARLAANTPRTISGRHGVLVKTPKAGQELRVDMPTIGPDTVSGAAAAGLAAIAVAAGQVLILDRAELERRAREAGVAVYILPMGMEHGIRAEAAVCHLRQMGRIAPSRADIADIRMGVETITRLTQFKAGAAAAVVRGHVLAIAAAEAPDTFAARVAALRQWGAKRLPAPRGALVVRIASGTDAVALHALIPHLTRANIAGLALVGTRAPPHALPATLIANADAAGVFVVDAQPPLFNWIGAS